MTDIASTSKEVAVKRALDWWLSRKPDKAQTPMPSMLSFWLHQSDAWEQGAVGLLRRVVQRVGGLMLSVRDGANEQSAQRGVGSRSPRTYTRTHGS